MMDQTQTNYRTQPAPPLDRLEHAIHLAKSGRKIEARNVLRRVVALQPVNQAAWLWLSGLAVEQAEAEAALAQAKKINPAHPSLLSAEQWLVQRFSPQSGTKESKAAPTPPLAPAQQSTNPMGLFNKLSLGVVAVAMLIGLAVLLLGLGLELNATAQSRRLIQNQTLAGDAVESYLQQYATALETAQTERDWPRVIAILEVLHQAEPDSQLIAEHLAEAYVQKGVALRHKGFIEEALTAFEQALTLDPQLLRAQAELQLASDYLAGTQHYQAGQWTQAISGLEAVWAEDPAYGNVKDLLYSAYYNHGLAQQAAGELTQATAAFEAALALRPDLSDLRLKIAELEYALAPETPPAVPILLPPGLEKTIVVGIAEQRMHVYEGKRLVYDFVVSTGEPGRDTGLGEFEIQNKLDMAYASTWNLDMPYWMGIYWAGPLQNGIHGLPTVKHTGYKLWDGYLGQRVSYGCVILGDEEIVKLYNWAEVGTRVTILPSLEDWTSGKQ